MTDHLPECHHSTPDLLLRDFPVACICPELRTREQRVLDAAREAVEAIPADYKIRGEFETYSPYAEGRSDFKDGALAAIDALKEKP